MIGKLLYLCPSCGEEDSLHQIKKNIVCDNCQFTFSLNHEKISINNTDYSITELYDLIHQNLTVDQNFDEGVLRVSQPAILRQGLHKIKYKGFGNTSSTIEVPGEIDRGILQIERDKAVFRGKKKNWIFYKSEITGFTTNSNYFEFKIRHQPFFQIYFEKESPLKYEDLFLKWIESDSTVDKILEHQPYILSKVPSAAKLLLGYAQIKNWNKREKFSVTEWLLHLMVGLPITCFMKWYARLTFENKDLIPDNGPFILIMNHESYLDPILMSTLSTRRIGFFTKSTSFTNRLLQPIFRAYRSMPNRRYEIDPHVVRLALKKIKAGECIGIFPEGERTWNGRLLSFKYNTVRFLMSVQIPIVVVKIEGAFKILPRWTHRLQPGTVKIKVLRCFSLLPGKWDLSDLKNELESYYLN